MNIELRNVKRAAFASRETDCFEAAVYVDGRKAGEVSNEGQGGPNSYHPWELRETLQAEAAKLPEEVTEFSDPASPDGKFHYRPDADGLVGKLLTAHLVRKDFQRAVAKRLLFVKAGKLYQTKALPDLARILAKGRGALLAQYGCEEVLNLMPAEEAFALYQKAGA